MRNLAISTWILGFFSGLLRHLRHIQLRKNNDSLVFRLLFPAVSPCQFDANNNFDRYHVYIESTFSRSYI